MIHALEIRLLGPFDVLAGGRPANVSGSKRREEGERLFARIWKLLALRGAVAIVFAFVLLVWPVSASQRW